VEVKKSLGNIFLYKVTSWLSPERLMGMARRIIGEAAGAKSQRRGCTAPQRISQLLLQ
jgi:hypothetical protein